MKSLKLSLIIILSGVFVGALSCSFDPAGIDAATCGDGTAAGDEECDGSDTKGVTCLSLGYEGGELGCTAGCTLDLSACQGTLPTCGNDALDQGEGCDGELFGGITCATLGFAEGTLACTDECRVDTSGCSGTEPSCGNGIIEGDEECDQGDFGGAACNDYGFEDGTLTCTDTCTVETSNCTGLCGDGEQGGVEECDGEQLAGRTCEGLGYYGGELGCLESCRYDVSDCATYGMCGDSTLQASYGESCDGADLNGATCESLGYYGGALACDGECTFDESGCAIEGMCGDQIIQATYGETCDGSNLDSATCEGLGYYGGDLSCDPSCHFALADCESFGRCGDSTIQTAYGEQCDGVNTDGVTCISSGYYGGDIGCESDCSALIMTDCEAHGRCGDLIVQSGYAEVCDTSNLDGGSCRGLGNFGGTVSCAVNCLSFNDSLCEQGYTTGSTANDWGVSIASDPNDNLYVIGHTSGGIAGSNLGGSDIYYAKFNLDGSRAWHFQYGGAGDEYAKDIAYDGNGNVYLVGRTNAIFDEHSNNGNYDGFVTKVNAATGARLWTVIIGTPTSDAVTGVVADSAGDIYISGWTTVSSSGGTGTEATTQSFVAKLSGANGAQLWRTDFGGPANDYANGIAVDSSDNVYVTGSIDGTFSGLPSYSGVDIYVGRFSATGNEVWLKKFSGTSAEFGYDLVVDSTLGQLYAVGYTTAHWAWPYPADGGDNMIILALSTGSGDEVWRKEVGTTADDRASGVALDSLGRIYVSGYSEGDLNGNTGAGQADIAMISYNSDGSRNWTRTVGGTLDDQGVHITVSPAGAACAGGFARSSFSGLTNAGAADLAIWCEPLE